MLKNAIRLVLTVCFLCLQLAAGGFRFAQIPKPVRWGQSVQDVREHFRASCIEGETTSLFTGENVRCLLANTVLFGRRASLFHTFDEGLRNSSFICKTWRRDETLHEEVRNALNRNYEPYRRRTVLRNRRALHGQGRNDARPHDGNDDVFVYFLDYRHYVRHETSRARHSGSAASQEGCGLGSENE